jgi:hypothetical protein
MSDIVKISANLPADAVEALKKLAAKRGISMTEVLRTAIGTEAYLDKARTEDRQKVLLEDEKGKIRELVFTR